MRLIKAYYQDETYQDETYNRRVYPTRVIDAWYINPAHIVQVWTGRDMTKSQGTIYVAQMVNGSAFEIPPESMAILENGGMVTL